jgi:hypothetical protein
MRDDGRRQMPAELVLMEQRHSHGAKAAGVVGAGWVDWEPSSPAARRPSLRLRLRLLLWTPLWARLLVSGSEASAARRWSLRATSAQDPAASSRRDCKAVASP